MKTYCVIIGDINKSRSLADRERVQRKFQQAIDTINKEFKTVIAAKLVLALGDEFQGLLKTPAESYKIVRRFQDLMEPVSLSFGIGVGTLSTSLKSTPLGMDGECFHRARAAVQKAKRAKRRLVYDFNDAAVVLVNALIGLMDKQWKRLTSRQQEIMRLIKEYSRQEVVANKLHITQQAVSKAYTSTVIKEFHEADDSLREFLQSLGQP